MPKVATGAKKVESVPKLKLGWLMKRGILQKGRSVDWQVVRWSNNRGTLTVYISSVWNDSEMYLTIVQEGDKAANAYKIHLQARPSNLGRGEVPYFDCPATGRACRTLYNVQGSIMWTSRDAYPRKLYYETQISSKRFKALASREATESRIKELMEPKRKAYAYGDRVTKRASRMYQLQEKCSCLRDIEWDLSKFRPNITAMLTRQPIAGKLISSFNGLPGGLTKREDFYSYEVAMTFNQWRARESYRDQLHCAAMLLPR